MAQSIQRETRSFKGVRIKSNCLSEVRIRLDARCAPVNSRFSMFKEIVNGPSCLQKPAITILD